MPEPIYHDFIMKDPRDPEVIVRPESDPWLTLRPGVEDGASNASVHRAKVAQRQARSDAIEDILAHETDDLMHQQLVDSVAAAKVAAVLPTDLSMQDRSDAGAVAVRLHDPRWQMVSRYHAADAALVELRKACTRYGWYAAESDLRELADQIAGVTHVARYQVWTNQIATSARTWARAALGFLSVREER